jgi:hypothetical protein
VGVDRPAWLWRRGAIMSAAVLVAVDTGLALRADAAAPGAHPWLTVVDLAVGQAFVAAAAAARGSMAQRWLVGCVGAAWLVGSWLPAARSLHQGVLVLMLVAFPDGRLREPGRRWPARWLPVVLAVLVGIGVEAQSGVAAVLALVALVSLADRRRGPTGRWYPTLAAGAAATALATAWWLATVRPDAFDPAVALLGWEAVLLVIAGHLPGGIAASTS